MTCFNENYLHEIPTDIQLNIMNIVKKEEEEELESELEWVEMIKHNIQREEYEDVIYILRAIVDGYYITCEEEFDDTVVKLIGECCDKEPMEMQTIGRYVKNYGVINAMKLGIKCFDMLFDIEYEDEFILYQKCYHAILKEAFCYHYDEYKLIMKYDISTM